MDQAVDLDLLADYAAGVLEPAQSAHVARLINDDPQWARVYAELAAADRRVRERLHELAQEPEPMPPDVMARVAAGVAQLHAAAEGAAGRPPAAHRPSGGHYEVRHSPARGRRGSTRVLALAAAAIAIALGSATVIGRFATITAPSDLGARADSESAGSPSAPPAVATPGGGSVPAFVSSGSSYTAASVTDVAQLAGRLGIALGADQGPSGEYATSVPPAVRDSAPKQLDRLAKGDALAGCLAAIAADHPGSPVLIDYARFNDAPALVVLVTTKQEVRVVVVQPTCGLDATSDEVYTAVL